MDESKTVAESGRAGVPSPAADGVRASNSIIEKPVLPERKHIGHRGPLSIDTTGAWYFITICAAVRTGSAPTGPFTTACAQLLDSARWYHEHGKWNLALFLVMPDHIHLIVQMTRTAARGGTRALPETIRHWKHFVSEKYNVEFQRDFWDTRIRNDGHFSEMFVYICNNPVRKNLCATPRDWPHVIAFDRFTGEELMHK